MIGGNNIASERAWKHRFAQTLFEAFCSNGVARAPALADAYAHADAQYLVRGLASPEDEARSALSWIRTDMTPPAVTPSDSDVPAANPHNGSEHIKRAPILFLGPDLPD